MFCFHCFLAGSLHFNLAIFVFFSLLLLQNDFSDNVSVEVQALEII